MAMAPYRYTSESVAKWWRPKDVIASVSADNFFIFRCTWLVLTHSWYLFCKKDTMIKNDEIFWKEINSLKKGEGVPLLNFEGGPGVPLLNFERGPGVPLLNFWGVPDPSFKLWGGSQVQRSRFLGFWSHFYTMPYFFRVSFDPFGGHLLSCWVT